VRRRRDHRGQAGEHAESVPRGDGQGGRHTGRGDRAVARERALIRAKRERKRGRAEAGEHAQRVAEARARRERVAEEEEHPDEDAAAGDGVAPGHPLPQERPRQDGDVHRRCVLKEDRAGGGRQLRRGDERRHHDGVRSPADPRPRPPQRKERGVSGGAHAHEEHPRQHRQREEAPPAGDRQRRQRQALDADASQAPQDRGAQQEHDARRAGSTSYRLRRVHGAGHRAIER
jgi:hypothetical protein